MLFRSGVVSRAQRAVPADGTLVPPQVVELGHHGPGDPAASLLHQADGPTTEAHGGLELQEALDEGVVVKWLNTIKSVSATHFTVEKMRLDERGYPQPTGEFETVEADTLVLALGQDVDLALLGNVPGLVVENGVVKVDRNMMTGSAGIFAGGDMVPSERTDRKSTRLNSSH